jgi:DNA invertase Pin-like site-specific DNA recombinase
MLEIMEILSEATRRKIRIFASKGNWSLDGSIQSKMVATCFALASEIEHDLISQRTRAALATSLRSKRSENEDCHGVA